MGGGGTTHFMANDSFSEMFLTAEELKEKHHQYKVFPLLLWSW